MALLGFESGARLLSKGLRSASALVAGIGAAMIALEVARRLSADTTEPVRIRLKPGQSIRVVVRRPDPESMPTEA